MRIDPGYSMPPPPIGSRARLITGNGGGPNRSDSCRTPRSASLSSAVGGVPGGTPTRTVAPDTDAVATWNGPTATLTSRARSAVACQRRRPLPAATGSSWVPLESTVYFAGAVTVRSTRAASLVALSAVYASIGSSCHPTPRSHASSGCPLPHQA
jgi:hypothetical protein